MQLQAPLNDLSKPENIQQLASVLSDLAEKLDVLYSETVPNGNISARIGRICIYKNGSSYEQWMNVDGSTTWQRIDYGAIILPLAIASGGTGNDAAQEAIDALLPSQASASGKFLTSNGTNASWGTVPVDVNTSNVVFCFGLGGGSHVADNNGVIVNDSITAPSTNITNAYWAVAGNSYKTILASKFKKIAGISTVTVWCSIWTNAGSPAAASCQVSIGTTSGSVTGTAGQQTPEWKSFDIDVSSLTNGTTYDVTIQLKEANSNNAMLDSIIGIAS